MFKPDHGRAWVVLVAAILGASIVDGLGYSFGLIYTELLRVYNASYEVTSWVGSLQQACGYICSLPIAYLIEATSCRTTIFIHSIITATSLLLSVFTNNIYILYITLGGLTGVGLIGIELAVQLVVQRWFVEKRLLANGILCSGTGWGMVTMGPVVQWLLSSYGLHGTFLVLSAIALNGLVSVMLIPTSSPENDFSYARLEDTVCDETSDRKALESKHDTSDGSEMIDLSVERETLCQKRTDSSRYQAIDQPKSGTSEVNGAREGNWGQRFKNLMTNKQYVLFTTGSVLSHTAMKATITFFPDRAVTDFQLTSHQAAILVTILGATNICGRPILGLFGSTGISAQKKQIIYALSAAIMGGSSLLSTIFKTMGLQIVFVIVFGLSCALMVTYEYPVLCDVIEMSDLEKAAGFYHSLLGVGVLFFIPLSGWLVDLTGNYIWTFIVFGIVQFTAAVILFSLPILTKIKTTKGN